MRALDAVLQLKKIEEKYPAILELLEVIQKDIYEHEELKRLNALRFTEEELEKVKELTDYQNTQYVFFANKKYKVYSDIQMKVRRLTEKGEK